MDEVYADIARHIPHLERYARRLARTRTASEDLVQETLLQALAKSHLYRPGTNLRAWLTTILRHQHVSALRRSGREGITLALEQVPLETPPDQEAALLAEALEEALGRLPDGQRLALLLFALHGRSYDEVAAACGISTGTVKSRISRGRSFLRTALEGAPGGGDRAAGRAQ